MLRRWALSLAVMGLAVGMASADDEDLPPPQRLQPVPAPSAPVLPAPRPAMPAAPMLVLPPHAWQPLPPGPVFPPPYPLRSDRVLSLYPYPPPPVYYRVSAYQVWQNYSVNMFGQWRARVISTENGSYYNGNGYPYPWARTRIGEIMPWGPSSAP